MDCFSIGSTNQLFHIKIEPTVIFLKFVNNRCRGKLLLDINTTVNREQCTQTQYDRRVLGDPFQKNPLSLAWRRCMSEDFYGR